MPVKSSGSSSGDMPSGDLAGVTASPMSKEGAGLTPVARTLTAGELPAAAEDDEEDRHAAYAATNPAAAAADTGPAADRVQAHMRVGYKCRLKFVAAAWHEDKMVRLAEVIQLQHAVLC